VSATLTALAVEFDDVDFSATLTAVSEEFDDIDFSATATSLANDFDELGIAPTLTALAVEFEDLDIYATVTAVAKELEDLGITLPPIEVPDITDPFGTPTPASRVLEPERMSLNDFKQLYDNPATRPIVLDVRSNSSYQGGHIEGAISFPLSEADSRINELSKDKLIVAYCQ
jgi:hypothetical protein